MNIARLYTYNRPDRTTSIELEAFVSMQCVCIAPSNKNTLKCTAISTTSGRKLTEYDVELIRTDLEPLNEFLGPISPTHVVAFHQEEEDLLLYTKAIPRSFNCVLVTDTEKVIKNKHGVIVTPLIAPNPTRDASCAVSCEYEIEHPGKLHWVNSTTN